MDRGGSETTVPHSTSATTTATAGTMKGLCMAEIPVLSRRCISFCDTASHNCTRRGGANDAALVLGRRAWVCEGPDVALTHDAHAPLYLHGGAARPCARTAARHV